MKQARGQSEEKRTLPDPRGFQPLWPSTFETEKFRDKRSGRFIPERPMLLMYLALNANREDKMWKGITVRRGQVLTTLRTLDRGADSGRDDFPGFRWGRDMIRHHLRELSAVHSVEWSTVSPQGSPQRMYLITVCGYEEWSLWRERFLAGFAAESPRCIPRNNPIPSESSESSDLRGEEEQPACHDMGITAEKAVPEQRAPDPPFRITKGEAGSEGNGERQARGPLRPIGDLLPGGCVTAAVIEAGVEGERGKRPRKAGGNGGLKGTRERRSDDPSSPTMPMRNRAEDVLPCPTWLPGPTQCGRRLRWSEKQWGTTEDQRGYYFCASDGGQGCGQQFPRQHWHIEGGEWVNGSCIGGRLVPNEEDRFRQRAAEQDREMRELQREKREHPERFLPPPDLTDPFSGELILPQVLAKVDDNKQESQAEHR